MKAGATHSRITAVLLTLSLTLGLALAAITFAIQTPGVAAHAKYKSSVPAANATVTEAPTVVTVHFGEDVNPAGSDLVVYDTKGKAVSTAAATVDTNDATTMTVPMAGDDSDSYLVVWHTVSLDDGDAAVGAFVFKVGSPAKAGDGGGTTTAPGASAGGTGASATTTSSGAPTWVVVLVGVIGLIVGGAGSLLFARQRTSLK